MNIKQAKRLALITIAWNLIEGSVALLLGFSAGSVALVGFGLDSAIETVSAGIVGWRFWSEQSRHDRSDQIERKAAKAVGILLLCLAAYITCDAVCKLTGYDRQPAESLPGMVLSAVALIIMPLLARAKYRSARELESGAMKAEAFQSLTCAWLAGATLIGLGLNAAFHWAWADPVAALLFVPAVIKEGVEALKGKLCSDC